MLAGEGRQVPETRGPRAALTLGSLSCATKGTQKDGGRIPLALVVPAFGAGLHPHLHSLPVASQSLLPSLCLLSISLL